MGKLKPKPRKPIKVRKRWLINPRQRVKKSNKIYSRTKERQKLRKRLKKEP